MTLGGVRYSAVWAVDFEFSAPPGERPRPLCVVGHELISGRTIREWADTMRKRARSPFDATDGDGPTLFLAYFASAEIGCYRVLGWPVPGHIVDLYAEFRVRTNGVAVPCGDGLLGALTYFGIDGIAAADKTDMRELAMRGGDYSPDERRALLDYCESDVRALAKLFTAMRAGVDFPRALIRGAYMAAVADMEHTGVPIDTATLAKLRTSWADIQHRLIARVDADYGVFDDRTFKADRWAAWLAAQGIPWSRLPTGTLALDDNTFRDMARSYPQVGPMRELRASLSRLRLSDLAVGSDGRNRTLLSPFRSRTGRNQPSNSKFIFGPSVWLRGLIQPAPGNAVAYIDWSQQEFAIVAALAGDGAMMEAYRSGDPYLAFAKQAGAVPDDATKHSHAAQREQFKACVLAVQYGMGAESLALRIGQPPIVARRLLDMHKQTYRDYWRWSQAAVDIAMTTGKLNTVFGWTIHVGPSVNPRSLANFPAQANGAEMLRLACIYATRRGVSVCCPVHDAILIEARADEIADAVQTARAAMADASAGVLGGFKLRTDADIVRHPTRYADKRGVRFWNTVCELIDGPAANDAGTGNGAIVRCNATMPRERNPRPNATDRRHAGRSEAIPTADAATVPGRYSA